MRSGCDTTPIALREVRVCTTVTAHAPPVLCGPAADRQVQPELPVLLRPPPRGPLDVPRRRPADLCTAAPGGGAGRRDLGRRADAPAVSGRSCRGLAWIRAREFFTEGRAQYERAGAASQHGACAARSVLDRASAGVRGRGRASSAQNGCRAPSGQGAGTSARSTQEPPEGAGEARHCGHAAQCLRRVSRARSHRGGSVVARRLEDLSDVGDQLRCGQQGLAFSRRQ